MKTQPTSLMEVAIILLVFLALSAGAWVLNDYWQYHVIVKLKSQFGWVLWTLSELIASLLLGLSVVGLVLQFVAGIVTAASGGTFRLKSGLGILSGFLLGGPITIAVLIAGCLIGLYIFFTLVDVVVNNIVLIVWGIAVSSAIAAWLKSLLKTSW